MSFTYFPNLPLELQLQIWESALPNTQTISISHRQRPGGIQPSVSATSPYSQLLHSLLASCTLSRDIVLKHHRLFPIHASPGYLILNPSTDSLAFTSSSALYTFTEANAMEQLLIQTRYIILAFPLGLDLDDDFSPSIAIAESFAKIICFVLRFYPRLITLKYSLDVEQEAILGGNRGLVNRCCNYWMDIWDDVLIPRGREGKWGRDFLGNVPCDVERLVSIHVREA